MQTTSKATSVVTGAETLGVVVDQMLTIAEKAADATTQLAKKMRSLSTDEKGELPSSPKGKLLPSFPKGKPEAPPHKELSAGHVVGDENMITTASTGSSSDQAPRKGSSGP